MATSRTPHPPSLTHLSHNQPLAHDHPLSHHDTHTDFFSAYIVVVSLMFGETVRAYGALGRA